MQRAEAEAAKVYEEFVDSFADSNEDKSFVRGGTIQPGSLPTRVPRFWPQLLPHQQTVLARDTSAECPSELQRCIPALQTLPAPVTRGCQPASMAAA